jgi:hypothetical protein
MHVTTQINVTNNKALLGRTHATQSSKISSSDSPLERPPMLDINNNLHAMVDEFVSSLPSECDSVVNNIYGQSHMYACT